MTYADALQSWRDFYVTAGAAAATLVGLLFVGLSLHIQVVVAHADVPVSVQHPDIRQDVIGSHQFFD